MNHRKNLIAAAFGVALLLALLIPLERLLSLGADSPLYEKQAAVMQAMEEQTKSKEQHKRREVLPMMDIEEIWALEDMREETTDGLVTAMFCGDAALGYDAAEQTFYCAIGTGLEEWPQIALSACGVQEDVSVAWVDDYAYDWCSDAVSEGIRYELFAWTETEFCYFGVVFTGLPVVTLHAPQEIGETYVPARWTVSCEGYEAIDSAALVHLRGGGFEQNTPKDSYRIEQYGLSGEGTAEKSRTGVLGMDADSDWLLIANTSDETRVLNHLAWDLWNKWNPDGQAFALLESRMVELFVNDEYMGLYQLMQRMDVPKEIERMGGSLNTDIGMRVITKMNIETRPVVDYLEECSYIVELRYKPEHMSVERAFEEFEIYHKLNSNKDGFAVEAGSEEFVQLALQHMDAKELMEYFLFHQIASFGYDNVFNNVYLWALKEEGKYKFYFAPWDMDSIFKPVFTDGSDLPNMWFYLAVKMLDEDVGQCRQILWELLEEKKEVLLTDDEIYQWFMETEDQINASGAYRRESLKWIGEERALNLAGHAAYIISHRNTVEFYMQEMWPLN